METNNNCDIPKPRTALRRVKFFGFGILVSAFIGLSMARTHHVPFDSASWKSAEVTNVPTRMRMIDDLLAKYDLKGISRVEVEGLLGKPAASEYFHEYEYVYWLGPERSFFSVDSEWLGLKFTDDYVSEYALLRD